jgi:hypothetical protein
MATELRASPPAIVLGAGLACSPVVRARPCACQQLGLLVCLVLRALLALRQVLASALFVITLFLLETPYVGFNALLTASVSVLFALAAIVLINKSPSAYSVRWLMLSSCVEWDAHLRLLVLLLCLQIGLLVGASLVVLVLSFQGALFWV